MFKNYFTVAWRHLIRHRIHSAINIIGLAAGMAISILIALWVWDELTFDRYHQNYSRLAEIVSIAHINGGTEAGAFASFPVAAELHSKYPDDVRAVAATTTGSFLLTAGDKKVQQWGCWVSAPEHPCSRHWRGSGRPSNDTTPIARSTTSSPIRPMIANSPMKR